MLSDMNADIQYLQRPVRLKGNFVETAGDATKYQSMNGHLAAVGKVKATAMTKGRRYIRL